MIWACEALVPSHFKISHTVIRKLRMPRSPGTDPGSNVDPGERTDSTFNDWRGLYLTLGTPDASKAWTLGQSCLGVCENRRMAMAKMKAAVAVKAGGDFEIQEREIPTPGFGEVRIKVEACGVCFGDNLVKDGHFPGLVYPRVPGHEIAGVVDEVGAGVTEWKKGERVGTGWHGGHDFVCEPCRRGDFLMCKNS